MPINYETGEFYHFDFESLFNMFSKQKIFDDLNIQKEFLQKWKVKLIEQERLISISNLIPNCSLDAQIFNTTLTLESGNVICLNFVIDNPDKIVKDNSKDVKFRPVLAFKNPRNRIKWTYIDSVNKINNFFFLIKPVILIPYALHPYLALIIDGNHRISALVKYKPRSFIKVCTLSIKYMVANNMFASDFDKYLYLMFMELSHFMELKKIHNLSDETLVSMSRLSKQSF